MVKYWGHASSNRLSSWSRRRYISPTMGRNSAASFRHCAGRGVEAVSVREVLRPPPSSRPDREPSETAPPQRLTRVRSPQSGARTRGFPRGTGRWPSCRPTAPGVLRRRRELASTTKS